MRIILAITVCRSLPYNCETLVTQPEPNGIAQYIDLTPVCSAHYYDLWRALVFIAAILFATNRFTFVSLLVMCVIHTSIFTLKNSQGWIGHNNQIISLPLLIQCIHYGWCGIKRWFLRSSSIKSKMETSSSFENFNGNSNSVMESGGHRGQQPTDDDLAVWYSQQAIVATYVISAVTKHVLSFEGWVQDSPNLVLQVLKTNEMGYYNFLLHAYADDKLANFIVEKLLETPKLAILMFGPAYVLEALAFLALYNRLALLLGGISLISMHLGISLIMRLNFKYNEAVLFAYFVNLPYWANLLYRHFVVKSSPSSTSLPNASPSLTSTAPMTSNSVSSPSSSLLSSSVQQKKLIDHIL
eukprot:TRINITY_DN10003_c0_g1_i1.p1 TRINITY_DN10003_c0_g1~~TRINITY_DN10003_c0_g1_i1.p1  ORF type:complete len:355 (-),score=58.77 TRINITY_DN10003_c0_g1_i1:23-1087(-)